MLMYQIILLFMIGGLPIDGFGWYTLKIFLLQQHYCWNMTPGGLKSPDPDSEVKEG